MNHSASSRDFRLSTPERWPKNLRFKLFPSIHWLKKLIELRRFYINITSCVGIRVYWSEVYFSGKKNLSVFETSIGSSVPASFTDFQCQETDDFDSIQV